MPATLSGNRRKVSRLELAFLQGLGDRLSKNGITRIEAFHMIQKRHGYLPREVLEAFSEVSGIPREEIQSFVTFYGNFRLKKVPPYEVMVCSSLPCHLRGGTRVLEEARRAVRRMRASFFLREVSCLGRCDGAPCMMINESTYGGVNPQHVAGILSGHRRGVREVPITKYQRLQEYWDQGGYQALRRILERPDSDGVIETLKESGLRGMGGAGFGTGMKWEFVRKATGDPKYVVVNADEGEPGTFKDRYIIENTPHALLEGLLIAMATLEARLSYIYVRDEYHECKRILADCLQALKTSGAAPAGFEVRIVSGAGSYVCGEETAMLESIEGRRGEPRLRPPYPATNGLWGSPTLINNVETLALVPGILSNGPDWYRSQGRNGYFGFRYFSLSGDVRKPGVYKAPIGTTASELIEEYGGGVADGGRVKAFIPGGVSTGLLPADMVDVPLSPESLAKVGSSLGSAAVIVLGGETCIVDAVQNSIEFFAHESCGKCTPCRVGCEKMLHMIGRIRSGRSDEGILRLMEELGETMALASICGLGQTASNPISSATRYFLPEIEAHTGGSCSAGVCSMA